MRIIVGVDFQDDPNHPGSILVSYSAPLFGTGKSYGNVIFVPLDSTVQEIKKAIVDDIITSAAADSTVIRGRDIILPEFTQG
jgi:hypothetical protein